VKNETESSSSHWRRIGQRFLKKRLAVFALGYLLLVIVLAIAAPLITTHEPNAQNLADRFTGISTKYWLGTDNLGRDTFTRVVYGARTSMFVTLAVAFFGVIIAVPIGLVSGYRSGKVDVVVMRLTEALLSMPPLILALVVAGILGPGTRNLIIALVLVTVPSMIRIVRGQTLAIREEPYVDASNAIGTTPRAIMARRILPHVLSPLLVVLSVALSGILVFEASLSYLGLGSPPPNASWGAMLNGGFKFMATDARLMLVPAIAIVLAALAFNSVGDGLAEALRGGTPVKRRRSDRLGITSVDVRVRPEDVGIPPDEPVPDDVVLAIRDLSVVFNTPSGPAQVLDEVSIDLKRGEILGLVGESGCGKTVSAMSVLRLLPSPLARITSGAVHYDGRDLLRINEREMRSVRGREIAMVFQDPMASLDPAFTVGDALIEAQLVHDGSVSKAHARRWAEELLDIVGIPDARRRLDDFPHTFSGGMRQRVLIAMALANNPKVLIADEPTTALDVTVQAQIIELLLDLRTKFEMSVIFVTHDLGIVQELCDRVTVMYAGQVVEQASVSALFAAPHHAYSRALIEARPSLLTDADRLRSIPGVVPTALELPVGCRFQDRCAFATEACATPVPLALDGGGRLVRCVHADQIAALSATGQPPTTGASGR
jgi:peptide/nickel transport system permease protein